jgi:acyl carrier protein
MKVVGKFEELYNIVEESVLDRIIREVYIYDGSDVADVKDILENLDDLDYVEVLMSLESHYDITIPDSVGDLFNSKTVLGIFKSVNREKVLTELGIK